MKFFENAMKESYDQFKKKYKQLPEFNELNHYFEISDIEKDEFVLRNIKKKVSEKISAYTDIMESILQPETSFSSMHEAKYITQKERNIAIDIYTSFMKLNRYAFEVSVDEEESNNADFIKEAYDVFKKKKDDLKKLFTFLKDTWGKQDSEKVEIGYLR